MVEKLNEYFKSGLRGFERGYITSVEAYGMIKLFLQLEPSSQKFLRGLQSNTLQYYSNLCLKTNKKTQKINFKNNKTDKGPSCKILNRDVANIKENNTNI